MSNPDNINFTLEGNIQNSCLGEKLGKLNLEYQSAEEPRPFELLDCFDQSIRKTGQALIFIDKKLMLLQHDGTTVSQDAVAGSRFIADLSDGPLKAALTFVSPLRRILVVGHGALIARQVNAVATEKQTQVSA